MKLQATLTKTWMITLIRTPPLLRILTLKRYSTSWIIQQATVLQTAQKLTCFQICDKSQSSHLYPFHLTAPRGSPRENQKTHHLSKQYNYVHGFQSKIQISRRLWNYLFCSLPSPMSVKQELCAFPFRLKGSPKVKSDIPSSSLAGWWESLDSFPPHVILRLRIWWQNKTH